MATDRVRDEGDYFPFAQAVPTSTPEEKERPAFRAQRSVTPRGPIFPSLGEAHRNITAGRMDRNHLFRTTAGQDKFNEDIPLQDLSNPYSLDDARKMKNADALVLAHPSRGSLGRSLTDRITIAQSLSSADGRILPDQASTFDSADESALNMTTRAQHSDVSDNTVGRIYDQYARESDPFSSSLDDSGLNGYTFSHSHQAYMLDPVSREGAATRCGFRGEDDRRRASQTKQLTAYGTRMSSKMEMNGGELAIRKHRARNNEPPSQPPQHPCLDPPLGMSPVHRSVQPLFLNNDSEKSQGDHRGGFEFSDAAARRSLVPQPLRVPSNSQDNTNKPRLTTHPQSDDESSMEGEASTESSEDPFKYDSQKYRDFLRPGKERDVSCALRRVSQLGTQGDTTAASLEKSQKLNNYRQLRKRSALHQPIASPLHDSGVYASTAHLQAQAGPEEDYNMKRVVINQAHKQNKQLNEEPFGLSIQINDGMTGKMSREMTGNSDWVTEATSDAGFGNSQPYRRPQNQGIKATGSSIADYSDDDEKFRQHILNSKDHILQHPSNESLPNTPRIYRNLKDTGRKVCVPRPQLPRLNGFAQDSLRLKSDPASSQENQLVHKLSNPFRRGSYKRARANSNFTFKKGGPSKFEFRDSCSDYGPAINSNQATRGTCGTYGTQPSTSVASIDTTEVLNEKFTPIAEDNDASRISSDEDENHLPLYRKGMKGTELARQYGISTPPLKARRLSGLREHIPSLYLRDSGVSPANPSFDMTSPMGSKFDFPLLNLNEAQDHWKRRRTGGDVDETEDGEIRAKKAINRIRGRTLTTPTQLLSSPSESHFRENSCIVRAPHLSLTFTPPADHLNYPTSSCLDTPLSTRPRLLQCASSAAQSPETPATPALSRGTTRILRPGWFGRRSPRATLNDGEPHLYSHNRTARDTERVAVEHYVSDQARSRARLWFYMTVILTVLMPFFGLVSRMQIYNESLSWFTNGEVAELPKRQRRTIHRVFLAWAVILGSILAGLVTWVVVNKRGVA